MLEIQCGGRGRFMVCVEWITRREKWGPGDSGG